MWKKIKETFTSPKESTPPPVEEGPYYRSDRFFYQSSLISKRGSSAKDGWYFLLRGGEICGPFADKTAARAALSEKIENFKAAGITDREE